MPSSSRPASSRAALTTFSAFLTDFDEMSCSASPPSGSVRLDALPLHVGQLERAAAEVADDAIGLIEAGHHAERGQLSLALAGENVDLGAADALGFGNESLAVLGVSARRGGDRPQLRDVHAVAQGAKAPQRRKRLLDRVGGQQAGGLHLPPESGEHLLVEDRGRAARETFVDHEPHRVRPDIDDRNRRPVIETTLRDSHGGTPPLTGVRDGV